MYPDGTRAVSGLDLHIRDGEFVIFVGPSGCGKTTVLRMVAGLEHITEGSISIGGRIVNDVAPPDRDIAMIFQDYALYPHLTVEENIGFGLKLRGTKRAERQHRVQEVARLLNLSDLLGRRPYALSGGQRQRVAMGRAIVRRPAVFLMDEPLSNLDAKLRVQMRAELRELQESLGTTTIYITHDQVEAMTMGDRAAVMLNGVLQQVDTPQILYDRPLNRFVSEFVGSPAMNHLRAIVDDRDGVIVAISGSQEFLLPTSTLRERPALRKYVEDEVILGIRPENITDIPHHSDYHTVIDGKVRLREALGSEIIAHLEVNMMAAGALESDELSLGHHSSMPTTVAGRFSPRAECKVGESIHAWVDTRFLHFFDAKTGEAIVEQ